MSDSIVFSGVYSFYKLSVVWLCDLSIFLTKLKIYFTSCDFLLSVSVDLDQISSNFKVIQRVNVLSCPDTEGKVYTHRC